MSTWFRTCQECGTVNVHQGADPPKMTQKEFDKYSMKPCKKCKSEALDYGSTRDPREPIEDTKDEE